jgi:uncharacterized cupin superfamily protein
MEVTRGRRYLAHNVSEPSVDRIHRYEDEWVIMFKGGGTLALNDDGSKTYVPGRQRTEPTR